MNNNTMRTVNERQSKKNARNHIKNLDNKDNKKILEHDAALQNIIHDIKKASEELLQEEEKYRNLYESSPDLLRSIDYNGKIINCNKTYAAALGYSKKEVVGKSIFKHTAKKSHAELRRSIKEWKRTGRIVNREIWCERKDGTIFPTLLSGTSTYDKHGKITGRTIALRDITDVYESRKKIDEKDLALREKYTELKQAYKLVLETENKYRNLYDNSPIFYRTVDANGIIHDCNISYANALGYSREEIIGKSIFSHVAETSFNDLRETFHIWKTDGKVGERLIWLKRKDDTTFPVMLSAASIYNKKGELIGSNTILRDISDIYSAKQEAEEQKIKRLYAIGELSARIAHDLRNPLSVIKNAINIIKMQNHNLDKNTLYKFSIVDSAVERMNHQINEVLDFVNPVPLSMIRTAATEILQNVMDRMIIPDTVRVNLSLGKIDIVCDPYKMEIVLANLITNAIQAMNARGTISIRASENKNSVLLDVEDTGPGIPADHLSKIFDPLFTTRQIGTGLGLVSCKSIVEEHGGTIQIKTVMGKGTTFTITIPKRDSIPSP